MNIDEFFSLLLLCHNIHNTETLRRHQREKIVFFSLLNLRFSLQFISSSNYFISLFLLARTQKHWITQNMHRIFFSVVHSFVCRANNKRNHQRSDSRIQKCDALGYDGIRNCFRVYNFNFSFIFGIILSHT